MLTVERSIDIDARPGQIWDYLTDFSHWQKLTAVKRRFKMISKPYRLAAFSEPGEGAKVLMEIRKRGWLPWSRDENLTFTATQWAPQKNLRLEADHESLLASYHMAIAFEILPKTSLTTQVNLRVDLEFVRSPLGPFLRLSRVRRDGETQAQNILDRLKAAVSA